MVRLFGTLGVILYFDLFFVVTLKIKFGRALPLAYVNLVLLFLLCSFLNNLDLIKYLIILVALCIALYYFYLIVHNRLELKEILKRFIRPSLLFYVVFFVYLYFLLSNRCLFNVDDLGHWGAMVKDALRNNELYATDKFVLAPPHSYPPFTTLLETLFNKLLGGYNESFSMLAISSFMFSYFVQFLDRYEFKKKDLIKTIITFLTLVALTLAIQLTDQMFYKTFFYNCTYVDWLLSVLTAHALYSLMDFEDNFYNYLDIIFSSTALLLTKQIGFALALLVLAAFFAIVIEYKKINIKKTVKKLFFIILILSIVFFSWIFITKSNMFKVVFDTLVELANPQNFTDYQKIIFENYFNALFKTPLILRPIKLSYLAIVLIVSTVLLYFGGREKNNKTKTVGLFYLLGGVGYAFAMMLFYVFVLKDSEGTGLVMYGRYMQTYTYAGILLLFFELIKKYSKIYGLMAIFILSITFIEPLSLETIIYNPNYEKFRESEMSKIQPWIDNEYNYQSLVVINSTDIAYKHLLKYSFDEKGKNVKFYQPLDGLDAFEKILDENEMILIAEYDMDFYNNYWSKISNDLLYNCTLYNINKISDNKYKFEMIYTWDD